MIEPSPQTTILVAAAHGARAKASTIAIVAVAAFPWILVSWVGAVETLRWLVTR